jgi:hypothetical protein
MLLEGRPSSAMGQGKIIYNEEKSGTNRYSKQQIIQTSLDMNYICSLQAYCEIEWNSKNNIIEVMSGTISGLSGFCICQRDNSLPEDESRAKFGNFVMY